MEMINYKGINIKKNLYPMIKYIEDVEKYREELGQLSSSWDILALLGKLGDINIDIGKTKENFLNLTSTLLNHLSQEQIRKVRNEMDFKAQVSIDILIRNLFERTADIGFLSTDDDIRNYIHAYTSKYDDSSLILRTDIQNRFKEYVSKYSVYFDIVLCNTKGNIIARLDESNKVNKIDTKFVQKVLNTSDEYVETYNYHSFLPQYKKSLVYSYKVKNSNESLENIGVLCLCFRFTDEMKGVFDNLIDTTNKECITILDEEGCVIASSDKDHIPLETKLQIVINENYKIISYAGRDYIAKTCLTTGYQGFNGLKWYGHIMIPLDYAFLSDFSNNRSVNEIVIESMMNNEQHISKQLKEVFEKSTTIQNNLQRVIWNGNISQSKLNSSNREFSKSLLNEIGISGNKANSSLSNLNQTIMSSILKNSEFLSSLAIDIMDRNLYERANDCRWWALTSYFKEAFDDEKTISSKKDEITSILKYINALYTVYENLLVFDSNGKVISVSNGKYEHLIGKILTQDWIQKTLTLHDTSKYCVSKFEKTPLYNDEPTYIYSAAIRSVKDNTINGGIAVVFDSTPQFHEMLEDTIPNHTEGEDTGIFAIFTNREKKIISSTNDKFSNDTILDIDNEFFAIKNSQNISKIIEFDDNYYAVGVKCSSGYREYKSVVDDYKNDVLSLVFIKIGIISKDTQFKEENKLLLNVKNTFETESIELATFNIGNKFLAVEASNVLESVPIEDLQESIDIDNKNPFKGMVVHKDRLISILDIREFINEEILDENLSNIILLEYDKDNIEHCVGILVSSLEHVSLVEKKSIQHIQNHFLGTGTLVESLVDINDYEQSKVAMMLDIKKLDENLTKTK